MAFLTLLRQMASGPHRAALDGAMRLGGLLLLGAPLYLARILWGLRNPSVPHPVSLHEALLAAAAILLLWIANLLLVAGAALLRPVPRPPRPLIS